MLDDFELIIFILILIMFGDSEMRNLKGIDDKQQFPK